MTSLGDRPRLMAACDECGAVYAAIEKSDGTIAPIGRLSGCRCGSTEFSALDADVVPEEEEAAEE